MLAATVSGAFVATAALIETGEVFAGDGRSVAHSCGEAGDVDVLRDPGAATISTFCSPVPMDASEGETH